MTFLTEVNYPSSAYALGQFYLMSSKLFCLQLPLYTSQ